MFNAAISKIALTSCLFFAFNAFSANGYFEARNDAMGGTGVASSHYSVGPLANPALLSKFARNDWFSVMLPSAGMQVGFPEGVTHLPHSTEFDIAQFLSDNKNLRTDFQLGSSFVFALPTESLSVALVENIYADGSLQLDLNQEDIDRLLKEKDENNEEPPLTSRVSGHGAVIAELGVAFAKMFEVNEMPLFIGITPKYQCLFVASGSAHFEKKEGQDKSSLVTNTQKEDNCGNMNAINGDIGAALDVYKKLTVGLAVKNVIPSKIAISSVTYEIRPQATAGISLNQNFYNLALDVDLSPVSGFSNQEKRQFLSVGGELDLYKQLQLRAGYRYDMRSKNNEIITAGLGVSPFDLIHLDVTGMFNTKSANYGAIAQIKFTF